MASLFLVWVLREVIGLVRGLTIGRKMIHQVMMSGSLKKGVPTRIQKEDVERIFNHIDACHYTGQTVYIDGNFLTIYEGKLSLIEASRIAYDDTPRYDKIMPLLSRPIKTRSFSGFRIGLRSEDAVPEVFGMEHCFELQAETFQEALPDSLPKDFRALLKTFARVNNLRGV